ncbi:MAG: histidine triad nucleotide-binding protein [Oscillospiraceae bacterium]|nr:histidine triad nucleotide-binding protein [Oscillospiraceae bacterium]
MEDCIFCKIIKKEIPSEIVYEDEEIIAFEDINPVAPIHTLIVPKKHITSLVELKEEDTNLIGKIYLVANKIAEQKGILERGFRVVVNCGKEGGQVVPHIHYHLLGGKQLPTRFM